MHTTSRGLAPPPWAATARHTCSPAEGGHLWGHPSAGWGPCRRGAAAVAGSSSGGLVGHGRRQTSGRRRVGRRAACASANGASSTVVEVMVEKAPDNGRCLFAGVGIGAPSDTVWGALTDYERLGTFIPGLAENRCLSRQQGRARLLQVGEQDLALGAKFRARLVLAVEEHPEGMPEGRLGRVAKPSLWGRPPGDGFAADTFPRPRSPLSPATRTRDIAFEMEEGDFRVFRGLWRIQDAGWRTTRLSYAVLVRPQPWLPVALVQSRIRGEIQANLRAVRGHTERLATAAAAPATASR